ncbi:uncharacterized protein LOC143194166 [Rhynchophorus ferrugineus]|uniref:Uncharacterized protein n=1 Tax=Rhynchophorus ferrugineus TaxID=354439 RepID=A0A834IR98_RHYFE|nr:hypothetical protein GWI33_021458 [Rhynchophorus ferrugineus]
MYKLYFSIFACALLMHQSLATEGELQSSKDEAKKAFHKLMEAIDKALTEAEAALDKAMEEVQAKATELEGKAVAELDKTLDPLREKLNNLIAEATEKGVDMSKCQSYVDQFTNTPDQLVVDLIECINTQVQKAQSYVDDALNNAKKIEEDMNSIDSDIDNCDGNKWHEIKCYAEIVEKIAKDTKEAPQHIAEDVAKATALVTEIIPILEDCFTSKIKKAGEDALKDVKDFAVCVAIPF